jgi:hypothetical protein
MIDYLPSKSEALGSIPSITKIRAQDVGKEQFTGLKHCLLRTIFFFKYQ